jgi:hypothetical protein
MITVTEIRSEGFCDNDYRQRTIEIKLFGIVIYRKNIQRGQGL